MFAFGSVPLKCFLPDGDVDLTAVFPEARAPEGWAQRLVQAVERARLSNPPFSLGQVTLINAEVKLVKIEVEDLVVDVSVNSAGGLCGLLFLDAADEFIGRDNLFKRSVLLVKSWCFYESRVLGAHHALLSTYAIETLVLYTFNHFGEGLETPLDVLHAMLGYFATFDWEARGISLAGPVAVGGEDGEPLGPPGLVEGARGLPGLGTFLKEAAAKYAVLPGCAADHTSDGTDSSKAGTSDRKSFRWKQVNIVDPLLPFNNLGRSVSKSNMYRIRRAFAAGNRWLSRCLSGPAGLDVAAELEGSFFASTLRRCSQHASQADEEERVEMGGVDDVAANAPSFVQARAARFSAKNNLPPRPVRTSASSSMPSLGLSPTGEKKRPPSINAQELGDAGAGAGAGADADEAAVDGASAAQAPVRRGLFPTVGSSPTKEKKEISGTWAQLAAAKVVPAALKAHPRQSAAELAKEAQRGTPEGWERAETPMAFVQARDDGEEEAAAPANGDGSLQSAAAPAGVWLNVARRSPKRASKELDFDAAPQPAAPVSATYSNILQSSKTRDEDDETSVLPPLPFTGSDGLSLSSSAPSTAGSDGGACPGSSASSEVGEAVTGAASLGGSQQGWPGVINDLGAAWPEMCRSEASSDAGAVESLPLPIGPSVNGSVVSDSAASEGSVGSAGSDADSQVPVSWAQRAAAARRPPTVAQIMGSASHPKSREPLTTASSRGENGALADRRAKASKRAAQRAFEMRVDDFPSL